MTVPKSLVSPTLATLYMQQGQTDAAIAVLRALQAQRDAKKAEYLTQLLTRVSIERRGRHGVQGLAATDLLGVA